MRVRVGLGNNVFVTKLPKREIGRTLRLVLGNLVPFNVSP